VWDRHFKFYEGRDILDQDVIAASTSAQRVLISLDVGLARVSNDHGLRVLGWPSG
jgi:hypothetical protein